VYFLIIVAYTGSCLLAAQYNTLLNTHAHCDFNSFFKGTDVSYCLVD